MIKLRLVVQFLSKSGDSLIYSLNDSYYINQAVDHWLTEVNEDSAADCDYENEIEEGCVSDD